MKNIAIIGAGQIGSRHLQALSNINFPARITVVDPSISSLSVARARFNELPFNPKIIGVDYQLSLHDFSSQIDLAILATKADVRAEVIKKLVSTFEVKNLLLEKVLFQKIDDYLEIQLLLGMKGIKAWVNHPRRLFPFYRRLKEMLSGCGVVSYQAEGGEWGLACNGLHLIDHLAFLTQGGAVKIDTSGLDPLVISSKRKGYLEVVGSLTGQIGPHSFNLVCNQLPSPLVITISSERLTVMIDESNNLARMASQGNGWKWIDLKEKIVYSQSELTDKIANDILTFGRCDLPTLEETTELHVPFIKGLMVHMDRFGEERSNYCPIT